MSADRVDRLIAWLEAHRAELVASASGSVRFDFHGDEVRVDVSRSARLPPSATLQREATPVHPAAAS
jgi:hypothetical protein